MKKTALAAALAIAALSLSACTAAPSTPTAAEAPAASTPAAAPATSAPATPTVPSEMPSASPASSSAAEPSTAKPAPGMESPDEERQGFAEIRLNEWLTFQGAHNLGDFHKPYKFVTGWSSPAPDAYALTIDNAVEGYAAKNGSDVKAQLRKIGASFMASVSAPTKSVHVSTEDGKHETTVR